MLKLRLFSVLGILLFLAMGCSSNSSTKHYVLAEKLWSEGNYSAAVTEYEKVFRLDPAGKLGLQALFRAGMTQSLFTHQYPEAIDKFQNYVRAAESGPSVKDAKKQVAEIYYSKLQQYDQAIKQYRFILKTENMGTEAAEIQFRIAKAYYYLKKFDSAIEEFSDLAKQWRGSEWEELAQFEKAQTLMTWASLKNELYNKAMEALGFFIKKYPNSPYVVEAKFLIGTAYEEMEKLEPAMEMYMSIQNQYPSPKVILIKMERIKQRLEKKGTVKKE